MGIQGATATQTATAVRGALAKTHKRSLAQPGLRMAARQQGQTPAHSLSIPRDTENSLPGPADMASCDLSAPARK